jgi:hypothetical protein
MTLPELYTAALQETGRLGSGEVAEPDDADVVARKYAALYEMLSEKELVAWTNTDDVPSYADLPLTYMLAFFIASAFGVSGQKYMDLGRLGSLDGNPPSLAERMLRKQFSRDYFPRAARPEFF